VRLAVLALALAACRAEPYVAGELFEINDNGAWSWFMDERVVVYGGKLVVGSVRAVGDFDGGRTAADWGNVEVATYDLTTGESARRVLFRRFEQDDHDNPSFLPTDIGLLAVYTRHRQDQNIYVQRSAPGDPLKWGEPDVVVSPRSTTGAHYATYSNLFRLPGGRIVNFYRGYDQDPNFYYSDDDGRTWTWGGRLIQGQNAYSPYLKYCQDRSGAIHFVATEDHPQTFDNSLYHGVLVGDELRASDGAVLAVLTGDTSVDLAIWDFTRVFQGDADNVAWMNDIEVDDEGRPVVAFSLQKRGDPRDLRYGYARWDGAAWRAREFAYAGERLYENERDYAGLAALDPQRTDTVYFSSNADPHDGAPLISAADIRRHYELFRGVTADGGASWDIEPITRDSTVDNLRPLVPRWPDGGRTALVWMRGEYRHNRGEWTTAVVGVLLE
jgi:hypothetical protein